MIWRLGTVYTLTGGVSTSVQTKEISFDEKSTIQLNEKSNIQSNGNIPSNQIEDGNEY